MENTLKRLGNLPGKIARTYAARRENEYLVLHWARQGVIGINWGDKLNPVLARMISGKNVVHAFDVFPTSDRPIYYMIGSSLEHAQRKKAVVWGVGFISEEQGIEQAPAAVHAVRGYRSMERLQQLGIECPDVVGDPAFLLPRYYKPRDIGRRYKVGVIPHCYELDLPCVQPGALPEDSLLIDITGGVFDVIDQICSCDEIISSSLHGLICAEAYGVPSQWVKLSERPIGDGFKYHDFYSSIGKQVDGPISIRSGEEWLPLLGQSELPVSPTRLDGLNDRLLNACPFWPGSRNLSW
ncbi:polysaccharide pyruvyl transferase family protein [Marinobacter sp. G11]|uniref:polysaccharide pyruvyl transferase family protein n=1 Tax=Marinobacter sp. G11 TaxID=2903522 RepID=UPI001E60A8DE|nr:polysaccharide pyruvyl transferase family protein [Marinobacter sp. G11]MCE0760335.1 polysaccharide pyruvyl transferase family protein [Marinobacter sp. G11]